MGIVEFVEKSLGQWRSQRSAHHLAFQHFEAITSTIDIEPIALSDDRVIQLCKTHEIDPGLAVSPFRMSWHGESDWDDDEVMEGSCILVPVPAASDTTNRGKLLRDQGYAETIPAVGEYHFTEDGSFVLITPYERAAAEERIWFGTPDLRMRVSLIRTSAGTGVVTASFSSEIRQQAQASS